MSDKQPNYVRQFLEAQEAGFASDPRDAVVAAARVLFHEHYHGNVRTETVAWATLRDALKGLG